MRNRLLARGALACILVFAAQRAQAQTPGTLDDAIRGAAGEFSNNLRRDSKIAILSVRSGSERMSDYLIEELTSAIVSRRICTVVDRAQLDLVQKVKDKIYTVAAAIRSSTSSPII